MRRMHLLAYLKTGPSANHLGAWRHPQSRLDDIFSPERYEHIARVLEDARFDGCFFADLLALPDFYRGGFDLYLRRGGQISFLDPMTVLPLMARVTKHLGLGATLSTTFFPAYHLARMLGSLDKLSGGRAAWNIVTSATDTEARNFGAEKIPPREERYDRADEVLEACCALWSCWEQDAFVLDKEAGVFADPSKVRHADYKGRWIATRGPLSIPPSPQGRPVLMQAGASDRGREFAARWAEMVFCTPLALPDALALSSDIRDRMARYGRAPEECAILPSITVVVGETDSIAREKAEMIDSLADPELALAYNSSLLAVDLSAHRTETDVAKAQGTQGIEGSADRIRQVMKAEGVDFARAAAKPRQAIVGTAKSIADYLEEWFRSGACDGFVLWPTVFPGMFEEFCRGVVPELQRRGLFRTEYAGTTLRENLRQA